MEKPSKITFQFISEPGDVNFGGKAHGGAVMRWIDQTAYACARNWAETYCVTVYVGGIRFYKPINIGEIIKVDAYVIYTGTSSIHIGVDVYARNFGNVFDKKTHCVIIFVSVNEQGQKVPVKKWMPKNEDEKKLQEYAIRLKTLREVIDKEMDPIIKGDHGL